MWFVFNILSKIGNNAYCFNLFFCTFANRAICG